MKLGLKEGDTLPPLKSGYENGSSLDDGRTEGPISKCTISATPESNSSVVFVFVVSF